ncbi:MAG: SpoIID/LytB domain-containing protein [candidate division KSB1 bacterium]|nr:SpoIID/LytB domain-containing protein [candidate division KSB1 bacterium]
MPKLRKAQQPTVRIGMIRGADEVRLAVCAPHRLFAAGALVEEVEEPREYRVQAGEILPTGLESWVRFAVTRPGQTAVAPCPQGRVRRLTVGRVLKLPRLRADNREVWHLVGPFPDLEAAAAYRRTQPRPGELALLQLPNGEARGWAEVNGRKLDLPVRIEPANSEAPHLLLRNVLIGIEFHWQHYEDEHLRGVLEIAAGHDGKLVAVNELPAEAYLASVNSSEMAADCPDELLKAQTVAARSTLFATLNKHHYGDPFDLCADDHCQCYYGADRERERSWQAVQNTWGEVLVSQGEVCDARYSKICGGIIEDYRFVWEDRAIPYLASGIDGHQPVPFPARSEERARELIDSRPDVFCNTDRYDLPPSLRERCQGLFRWEVRYTQEELQGLLATRVGVRVGRVIDLVPLERGDSGRIVHLEVVGTEGRVLLGKELEIRRALSPTHLYSSCFYVVKEFGEDGLPRAFVLRGAGWGHGVGLCQVGATVMASQGYTYREILAHYYRASDVVRAY